MIESTYEVATQPAGLPVELALVKQHCRISHDKEDTLLLGYIGAARDYFESHTNRTLICTTYKERWSCFPADGTEIHLRFVPAMLPVVAIRYYDTANELQTLDASSYAAMSQGDGHSCVYHNDGSWPATYSRPDAVEIEYAAGHAEDSSGVPDKAKQCILMLVEHWNRNRSAVAVGQQVQEVPFAVKSLLASCDAGLYV